MRNYIYINIFFVIHRSGFHNRIKIRIENKRDIRFRKQIERGGIVMTCGQQRQGTLTVTTVTRPCNQLFQEVVDLFHKVQEALEGLETKNARMVDQVVRNL